MDATGATGVVSNVTHNGNYAAQQGSTAPTKGNSFVAQTYTAPPGTTELKFL